MRAIINTRLEREAGLAMMTKKRSKSNLFRAVFGIFFVVIGIISSLAGAVIPSNSVYADPVDSEEIEIQTEGPNVEDDEEISPENKIDKSQLTEDICKSSLKSNGWWVCSISNTVADAVDWLYDKIGDILTVEPVSMKDGSPIYEIWKYFLTLANIAFVIFFLVVIYSQLTGIGISNYGIKKALPKLIVVAVLVNLSFLICSLAVDVSNILGGGLRGVFTSVEESVMAGITTVPNAPTPTEIKLSYAGVYNSIVGGPALAIGGAAIAFETGAIWVIIPVLLGALVAVVSGLVTIALRQALVVVLIMIAPLAIVAYMLPNTDKWFKKWKDMLMKMLVFYPAFSLLFGASSLAGFAIMTSAKDGFGVILGLAVQIFPLFFSWKMMQMSGTILGTINTKMRSLAAKPLAANRAWADSRRQLTKQKYLASNRAYMPSLRLRQFLSDRRIARDEETADFANTVKNRGLAYNVSRKYGRNGVPNKGAEEDYAAQARNMQYTRIIERHKNNMTKGLGQLEAVKVSGTAAQKARLGSLDMANVNASDMLKVERARAEMIEYDNATGFHKRMEAAINAHMDNTEGYSVDKNGKRVKKGDYKFHFANSVAETEAMKRYNAMHGIMEGSALNVQYAAATAAQTYDTQKKIVEAKMQKYFDLTAPTRDVEYRLGELTRMKNAANNIDFIVSGLRILNQRGDTDLLKKQLDNLLDVNVGGGINLGTHASQALASFLMFEVKDNDPFLRRFGKYINLETARAYNANDRKVMGVTYDEYVRGYHDGEPATSGSSTGRMYAKKGMRQLVEGTSLDNIERTALSNLDESLKKAYGFDEKHPEKKWDVSGWLRKREEIQTAFEPAFLSASLKWLSGSEQINSGVKFWTGYELKQKKDEHGNMVVDENGDPEYDLASVWDDTKNGFGEHKGEVEEYYRRKTNDYFKDQTTGQILGMRTDYRDATMEHLAKSYLEDSSKEESSDERKRKYEKARAEIQTRYADKTPEEAQKLRDKDVKKLKMELAGRQVRKILGETGKLKQIYRTRTSGTAINAKDWLRKWVNLDDEEALRKEMTFYDEQSKNKKAESGDADIEEDKPARVYTAIDREYFLDEMRNLKDRIMDEEPEIFFEDTKDQLEKWFGENTVIVKKYEQYYKDYSNADSIELYKFLRDLLEDEDNYPDA